MGVEACRLSFLCVDIVHLFLDVFGRVHFEFIFGIVSNAQSGCLKVRE